MGLTFRIYCFGRVDQNPSQAESLQLMMHHNISVDSSSGAALHRDVIDDYGHEGDNGMNNKNCHGVESENCENGYGEDECLDGR